MCLNYILAHSFAQTPLMKIVLIGSGNLATVLGKLLKQAGNTIVQVISRNAIHAEALARISSAGWDTDLQNIAHADVYVIATSDEAINKIAAALHVKNKIVLHTSGSVSKDVLQNASENYGVLYPLQSLRREVTYTPVIPFLIDASNTETLKIIQSLADSVSAKTLVADDEQRLKLHVAAVISSNFSNHLYALTEAYCNDESVSFDMLLPLIQETANRLNDFKPIEVQTGPAARGDWDTIEKHLKMLDAYPHLRSLYESMSKSIIELNGKNKNLQ
ncbi:DUF2520 domain-containing protein [soil metagenome]